MKKMKKTIAAIFIAMLMLVVNSSCAYCMADFVSFMATSPREGALTYMEEKYGEKFEYINSDGTSFINTIYIYVSCESLPGKEITVTVDGDIRSPTYSDNYMEHYFKEQVEEYMSNVAEDYFDEFTLTSGVMIRSSDNVYLGMTFDEYLQNEPKTIWGSLKIADSDEETVREFVYELKRLGLHFSFDITILSVEERYSASYYNDSDDIEIYMKG